MSYREGFVAEVDADTYRVRVDFPDRKVRSPWLSVLAVGTAPHRGARELVVGEFVAVLLDAHETAGCVLGALYSRDNPPPSLDGAAIAIEFADGQRVEYDPTTHVLHVTGSLKVSGGSAPAANATTVTQALTALKAAISSAVPVASDGGAAFKSAILGSLTSWPPDVALSELTSD